MSLLFSLIIIVNYLFSFFIFKDNISKLYTQLMLFWMILFCTFMIQHYLCTKGWSN